MTVLYDHQIYLFQKFGGINRYFSELALLEGQGLSVNKINPDLFNPIPPGRKHDLFSRAMRFLKRKTRPVKEEGKFPEEVAGLFSNNAFDIFHPTYYDPYFLDLTSKPFVLTVYDMIHEIYKEYFPLNDPTSYNKRLLCQKAKQIIVISNKTKQDFLDIFKLPEEKVHTIPLACDFNKISTVKPADTEHLTNYILFTGVREGYKNFYFAVIALADILKADRSLQLLCTGHKFSNEELVFFKDLGISDRVFHLFLKNDEELAWAYQHAVLFIFPSLHEGFGFPMLEAFASSCPVIASKGGSLPEVGADAALFFNPKSVIQIQEAAASVLYSKDTRASLVEKGRLQFNKFSWDACRTQTMEVYRQALYR